MTDINDCVGGSGILRYSPSLKRAAMTLLLFCALAYAQSPLGLQYPTGIPDHAVTGSAAAMGGSGAAVTDEYWGTSLNPANAAIGERSAFGALVSFDITTVDDNGSSASVSGYTPKLLSLIVPLGRAGNLAFSMQKHYDANLNFYTTEQKEDKDGYGYKTNTIKLHRKGSLTAWQAGWAYRFRKPTSFLNGLSFGIMYERLYFNLENSEIFESIFTYTLENGNVTYRNYTEMTEQTLFGGDGIRLGMQIPFHPKLTLGAAVEYILTGDGNGTTTREYLGSDTTIEYSVTLPPSINIGVAYTPTENWLIAADAHSTLWDNYENRLWKESVQRVYGISAGCRFIPAPNKLISEYWQKIHYSAGVRYTTLPQKSTNDGAYEIGFSLGAGLPIPNDGGIVDVVVDFGRRADALHDNYSENIVKIQLGINGGRNWFQRE